MWRSIAVAMITPSPASRTELAMTPYGIMTQSFALKRRRTGFDVGSGESWRSGLAVWHRLASIFLLMTAETTLFAPASKFWTEVEGWLPGEATNIPEDLDFSRLSELPSIGGKQRIRGLVRRGDRITARAPHRSSSDGGPCVQARLRLRFRYGVRSFIQAGLFRFRANVASGERHNLPGLGDLRWLNPARRSDPFGFGHKPFVMAAHSWRICMPGTGQFDYIIAGENACVVAARLQADGVGKCACSSERGLAKPNLIMNFPPDT